MRTFDGSSGLNSSTVPPRVFVNLSVISRGPLERASSPMNGNQAGGADYQTRALRPVQISSRGSDRNGIWSHAQQLRQHVAHGIEPLRTELGSGTDQRHLCA